jgi:hypothetical protein
LIKTWALIAKTGACRTLVGPIRPFRVAIWATSGADLALLMARLVGLTPGGAARISVARVGMARIA